MLLVLPLPVGELLAEGEFFEFADGGAGDGVEEDEGVGELPLGEGSCEKRAQLFRCSAGAVSQNNGGERAFLPFRMRDAYYASFFNRGMTHQRVF